jgi:small-conductance mechanosensitive channel
MIAKITDQIVLFLTDQKMWENIMVVSLKIIIIIIIAQLFMKVLQKAIVRIVIEKESNPLRIAARRTKTVGKLVNNIITYVVNFIMILMLLNQIGVQVGPLLAGAGVVGLAIGFGAQSLVKDIITGFFIIFEDQFAVGDVIQTGTYKGVVEEIGLRVTTIKSPSGERHIIPNGSITQVTNFSVHDSVSTLDIPIDNETDIEQALCVIREIIERTHGQLEKITEKPEVLGLQSFAPGEMVIRILVKSKANEQFQALRTLNAEIKKGLDEHGISLSSGTKK